MRYFTISLKVNWCLNCNVPVIEEDICDKCGLHTFPLKLTAPADVRPAFQYDIKQMRDLLRKEMGLDSERELDILLPRNQVILLNKIPHLDAGDEVIVQGQVIAHRYYDLKLQKWRFRPMYAGVAKMLEFGIGYYAIVDLPKLARNYEIHSNKIIEANLPTGKKFVAVGTKNKQFQAIGIKSKGRRIRIIRAWPAKKPIILNKNSSMQDVIEANRSRLERLISKAVRLIEKIKRKHSDKLFIVSYSGGKDSLTTLHIAFNYAGIEDIIFNDTGLELPETKRNVQLVTEKLGLNCYVASANRKFFKAVHIYGPPARDYRWCCKVCKLTPIARKYKEISKTGIISIVGQRKYESLQRARQSPFEKSKWIPNTYLLSPILEWSALDVWMYIFREKLEYNELYNYGLDRVGCWLCPACEIAEFKIVERLHPNLWKEWEDFLISYAKSKGLPKEWVTYGWWRWKKLPGDQKRFIRSLNLDPEEIQNKYNSINYLKKLEVKEGKIIIDFNFKIDFTKIKALAPIHASRIEEGLIELNNEVIIKENKCIINVTNSSKVKEDIEEAFNIIFRSHLCSNCYSCVNWCPNNAIELKEYPIVNSQKCQQCGICNQECPTVKYIVQPILKALTPKLESLTL